MGRQPFNYKKGSHTMDEPSNIWDKMQADNERWSRHTTRPIHWDWTYVIVFLAIAVVFLGVAWLFFR